MRRAGLTRYITVLIFVFSLLPLAAQTQSRYFKIKVVDADTGRGVPLVELRTTNDVRWITDSNGIVAFDDAALIGRNIFFTLSSPGYSYKKDSFGYPGIVLDVKPGGSAILEMQRQNIAERLYRITGEGIYRDSVMVGEPAPTRNPQFNGQVMGQDTVEVTLYRGKLFWFWGDTNRSSYPLGNFHTSGATSLLPTSGGLNPAAGVDLTYFTDASGFCKAMLPNKEPGPVWVGGLCTLPDATGKERLLCNYARMKDLGHVLERGLALFNDDLEIFEPVSILDITDPHCPLGHPFRSTVAGADFLNCAISDSDPLPGIRVKRDFKHVINAEAYEAYSCLAPGTRYDGPNTKLDRDARGAIRYSWKPATGALSWKQQQELIKDGKLKPEEALIQPRDVETGKEIQPAGGSVFWNNYLHKWVMIFGQLGGSTSLLGEIWVAYADTPVGPWVYARKIVSHNNYTFYNPTQDPFFNQQGGKRIYFEGTYTRTFSGNKEPTPRYEYNQIMYGLSMDNPKLSLPSPVYFTRSSTDYGHYVTGISFRAAASHNEILLVPFFAIPSDVPHEGLVPLYELQTPSGPRLVTEAPEKEPRKPIAYAAPITRAVEGDAALRGLYEYRKADGSWLYATNPDLKLPGYDRSSTPICRVWPNPMTFVPLDWETQPKGSAPQ